MKNNIFTTSDQMVDYLNAIVISAGDTDQPTISAISSAQSLYALNCQALLRFSVLVVNVAYTGRR